MAFFATAFDPAVAGPRASDSDLEAFTARSLGGSVRWERRVGRRQLLFVDVGYERYLRSNDLQIHLVTGGVGWRR